MSYLEVMERVEQARAASPRSAPGVTLVAVSKAKSVDDILAVYEMGHRDFGENRAQELERKAPKLPSDIRWHFVGALQTNKARIVRPLTHLLHSLDRRSLAETWVKGVGLPPPVLVQVNIGEEPQKSGVAPSDVSGTLDMAVDLGLDVRGLMAIPPMSDDPEASRAHFAHLRSLRDQHLPARPGLEQLSMGMTDDYEIAVQEGASIIRVGRAIFGPRQ